MIAVTPISSECSRVPRVRAFRSRLSIIDYALIIIDPRPRLAPFDLRFRLRSSLRLRRVAVTVLLLRLFRRTDRKRRGERISVSRNASLVAFVWGYFIYLPVISLLFLMFLMFLLRR